MHFKRLSALLLAALLLFSAAYAASGDTPGGASLIFRSLEKLLFHTDNVTVETHAAVSYDGVQFKTVRGRAVRDGTSGTLSADFHTVRPNGTSYDTSWRVHSAGTDTWYYNSHDGEFYATAFGAPSDSVVGHDRSDDALIALAASVLALADRTAPALASVADGPEGRRVTLSLEEGAVPSCLDPLADYLVRRAALQYMDLDLGSVPPAFGEEEEEAGLAEVWYEDSDALLVKLIGDALGREVDAEEADRLRMSEDPSVNEAYAALWALEEKAMTDHDGGVAYLRADGTVSWYPTKSEFLLAEDLRSIGYEDHSAALSLYLEKDTGEKLTRRDIDAVYMGNSAALWEAFLALGKEMDSYYLAMLGEHPMGFVTRDGTLLPVDDVDAFNAVRDNNSPSIARTALTEMESVSIVSGSLTLDLDGEDRISSLTGAFVLRFTNADGSIHPVGVQVTASASAYGESTVGDFDPAAWGVVSVEEYYQAREENTAEEPLPGTVTIHGVIYPVFDE